MRAVRACVGRSDTDDNSDDLPEVQEPVLEQAQASDKREQDMKPIGEDFINESEELAKVSMKAMRQFLSYQGENQTYYHKAKIAAVGLTNYVRLRATENNRMMVELTAQRSASLPPAGE